MSGKKRCLYSIDDLKKALSAVNAGMSINAASKQFNIPRSTLDAKKKKIYAEKKPGPPTVLSNEEEKTLVDWIFYLSHRGFPVTKNQLLDSVQMLITKRRSLQKENVFVNDRPGRHWYQGFLQRHKNLAKRMTENLTFRRAEVTESALRNWFNEVINYLSSKELLNIAPERIFNCDEAGFLLNPKESSVLAKKGQKNVYKIVGNNEKESITVLFTGNAAGMLAPPLVLFSYKRIPNYIASKLPNGWSCGKSDSGWMVAANFYEYITNVFHPWLIQSGISLPVILYLDGHSSHMTKHLSDFCSTHEIELIAFYPNATHILQPMDVSVFRPIKMIWKTTVNNYRMENKQSAVTKEDFGLLLNKALDGVDISKCLQNGFRVCGLYPLNADAVDYSKVVRNQNQNTQDVSVNDEAHEDDKIKTVLYFMRENLDKNIIDEFEKNKDVDKWKGNIEYKKLFEFWKICIKKHSAIKSQIENLDNTVSEKLLDTSLNVQNTNHTTMEREEPINIADDFSNCILQASQSHTENISEVQESTPLIEVLLCENENQLKNITETPYSVTLTLDSQHNFVAENDSSLYPLQNNSQKKSEVNIVPENGECCLNKNQQNKIILQELTNQDKNDLKSNVPFAFKESLFWPEEKEVKENKRTFKEKIPSVVTSEQWKKYQADKEAKKRLQEEQKETRKKIRLEQLKIKKEKLDKKTCNKKNKK